LTGDWITASTAPSGPHVSGFSYQGSPAQAGSPLAEICRRVTTSGQRRITSKRWTFGPERGRL